MSFAQAHATIAIGIVLEAPGTAPAGMDLAFHHPDLAAQALCCLFRLFCREDSGTAWNGNAKFRQQAFRLVFVNIHGKTLAVAKDIRRRGDPR